MGLFQEARKWFRETKNSLIAKLRRFLDAVLGPQEEIPDDVGLMQEAAARGDIQYLKTYFKTLLPDLSISNLAMNGLAAAVRAGNIESTKFFLDAGLSPIAAPVASDGVIGKTPLKIAKEAGHAGMIALLEKGANPSAIAAVLAEEDEAERAGVVRKVDGAARLSPKFRTYPYAQRLPGDAAVPAPAAVSSSPPSFRK